MTAAHTGQPELDGLAGARAMLARAEWAARAFAGYDKETVDRIVESVAAAAEARAQRYARWAVQETGFGVVEHKTRKNIAGSRGVVEAYRDHDYVNPRVDPASRTLALPRPAGVVLALSTATNPVCTVYRTVLLALLTRNAVLLSPHPAASQVCADVAGVLAEAARAAGAPDGVVQLVEQPSAALAESLMADPRTDLIVVTGGPAMVRAAYRSGTPALGFGPANVPVLVDASADPVEAATRIVHSKSFDNSVLCTSESVLIAEDAVADRLLAELRRSGAHALDAGECARLRAALFPGGRFDTRFVGRDAPSIAAELGLRVADGTRVLLAPFELAVPEEPLAHEKPCPVLGFVRVASARRGIAVAGALLRIGGDAGHPAATSSAAIHSADPATVMAYSAALPVRRVSVNVGNSLGASGADTVLAPEHLVNWARIGYNDDAGVPFGDLAGLHPWSAPAGPVPPYPHASNAASPSVLQ
jgi:acetaldehyde dehydrogenase / alcohol dehydrogenase